MFRKAMRLAAIVGIAVFVLSAVILASQEPASAQMPAKNPKGGGGGGFMFGLNYIDLGDLDSKLKAKGFSALEDNNIFFGGGGYGVVEKVILGGEGGGFTQTVNSSTQKATVSGGYGLFNVGYVLFSPGNLKIFPLLGLGGGGMTLKIVATGGPLSFDDILNDPGREVTVTAGGFLFNLGIGADYLLTLGEDKEGKGGLLFGIRMGYTFTPTKADWKMEDRDVIGGPDVRITGPYVHLLFGGGGAAK